MDNVRTLSRRSRHRLRVVLFAQVVAFFSCVMGWVAIPEVAALIVPTLIVTLVVLADDLMVQASDKKIVRT